MIVPIWKQALIMREDEQRREARAAEGRDAKRRIVCGNAARMGRELPVLGEPKP